MKLKVGDKSSYERSFTLQDIELFGELSGDKGSHHLVPDKNGKVMVQGFLTATLPIKLGGDVNYIAREITLEFLRPVFAGDIITSEAAVTSVEDAEGFQKVSFDLVCHNQDNNQVLRGNTHGIIRD
jgi:3-hydroxybutyryl-CoA dehydratase